MWLKSGYLVGKGERERRTRGRCQWRDYLLYVVILEEQP
ncbi:hypothetical protein SLEP1_g58680 [Rubroshorea leprosula]|uniref:Uncharacterized protein n=1 Tax=Rubroshorea leprosula TaxID=152421 RepID=A0AAV5MUL5_9ROSI|nr:hypothetical protein SLEP1_g58680 [Rubroshorea leprosula]